ncbi:Glutamine amidotransferase type 1 [Penicillium nucicola]|uniref:Glutamine amidotransferase type 1 n=1 Tax=Penicillium nucicola TaxID=1850975 RepID=UPI0025456FDC|nr:Glutamine amidotransferase type 1 [Penicillium nucicola]KAJ5761989.1 Glutamine amidotransferase type 1 [Penicillium nucicola]
MSQFKVALCRNYVSGEQWVQSIIDGWYTTIKTMFPGAVIDLFYPIDGSPFPNAPDYNLVILTGGTFNLTNEKVDQWVEDTFNFIQATTRDYPKTKILGICWGHQAVARALGGTIGTLEIGQLIGVQDIAMTEEGKSFFGIDRETLAIHKFHKRLVTLPPPGFSSLATDNEILLSDARNVLGFQGHPEMAGSVAREIIDADTARAFTSDNKDELAKIHQSVAKSHDGDAILERVALWAKDEL